MSRFIRRLAVVREEHSASWRKRASLLYFRLLCADMGGRDDDKYGKSGKGQRDRGNSRNAPYSRGSYEPTYEEWHAEANSAKYANHPDKDRVIKVSADSVRSRDVRNTPSQKDYYKRDYSSHYGSNEASYSGK